MTTLRQSDFGSNGGNFFSAFIVTSDNRRRSWEGEKVCAYKQYAPAPVEARVLRYLKLFAMRTAEKEQNSRSARN
ncbi:MAG: hypothetical protein DMF44_12200 [Verrucomicrobia bacterium]|nr:MAG: hypothetical protein DMF44_12200 [Verrucomicrobiota bacterium]